jgi:hypothetical protein
MGRAYRYQKRTAHIVVGVAEHHVAAAERTAAAAAAAAAESKGVRGAVPNTIDARSLEHREQNAQLFVEQVRERVLGGGSQPGEPLRIGVILSGPMGFASGEDLHPIEAAGKSDGRSYYFLYHSLPPPLLMMPPSLDTLRGRRGVPTAPPRPMSLEPLDSLGSLIKPLQPRVFDIYSPEQFRKALGTMLDEISRL